MKSRRKIRIPSAPESRLKLPKKRTVIHRIKNGKSTIIVFLENGRILTYDILIVYVIRRPKIVYRSPDILSRHYFRDGYGRRR